MHQSLGRRRTLLALAVLVLVAAGAAAAYAYLVVYQPGASRPQGALWSKTFDYTPGVKIWSADDDGIGQVVVSQDDSTILVGTGQAIGNGSIYAYGESGTMLWSHQLDRSVSSIRTYANGSVIVVSGYEIRQNPAGTYENPALFVFDGRGAELWNQSFAGQSVDAQVSSNGSRLAVATDAALLFMNDQGNVIWSFALGARGSFEGLAMSPDASSVTVAVYYSPASNISQTVSRSLIVFNSIGRVVSNRTTTGTLTNPPPGITSDLTSTASASEASSTTGQSCAPATFWNGDGVPSENFLSPDGHYAMVVSNWDSRATMFFVELQKNGLNCT